MKFTLAELKTENPKDWYVYYSFRNPATGKLVPYKIRDGINRIKDPKKRKAKASELIADKNRQLNEGWTPFENSGVASSELSKLNLLDAMGKVLEIKAPELRKDTKRTYKSTVNIFKDFLELHGMQGVIPKYFTALNAQEYSDYLITVRKHSPKTHNNNLINIKTLFNLLKDRELIDSEPFKKIKTKKEGEGRVLFYSNSQKETIKKHLKDTDSPLYLYVQLIFYCFIRPNELMKLKVKDIDFKAKSIFVEADTSKNTKNGIVPIHENLFPLLKNKYAKLDPETYLFGHKLLPNFIFYDRDRASEAHRKMLIGLGIDTKHKLYEWKHTGARLFILSGRNPYDLMIYMRHSSLDEVMSYIRSLGVNVQNNKPDPKAWTF